jgi:hypothetical protein
MPGWGMPPYPSQPVYGVTVVPIGMNHYTAGAVPQTATNPMAVGVPLVAMPTVRPVMAQVGELPAPSQPVAAEPMPSEVVQAAPAQGEPVPPPAGLVPTPGAAAPAPAAPPQAAPSMPVIVAPTADVFAPSSGTNGRNRFWASGEYLLWWIKSNPVPVPLATTGSVTDPIPGAIGQPHTQVLLGDADVNGGQRSGGRITVGAWLDRNQTFGIEGTFLFLANQAVTRQVSTSGAPGSLDLFVPFLQVFPAPAESTGPLGGPPRLGPNAGVVFGDPLRGQFALSIASQIQGLEVNPFVNLYSAANFRLQGLVGFRFLSIHESLTFLTEGIDNGGPAGHQGDFLNTIDTIDTKNHFYGAQAGIRGGYTFGRLDVVATSKVALGNMWQEADIGGLTATTHAVVPGFGVLGVFPGGAFAQPTNSGVHRENRFAIVPEGDLTVGYRIASWLRATVGYSFLYASNVARPGPQIDRGINLTQIPIQQAFGVLPTAPARPEFFFHESDFWAQGISFGLEFRY